MKCTLKKELKSILKNSYSQPDLCLWLGSGQLQLPVKLRPAAGGHNVTAAAGQLTAGHNVTAGHSWAQPCLSRRQESGDSPSPQIVNTDKL